jgi:hypothetical protein
MMKNNKFVLPFFLALLFISPTLVKFEHHHEHFTCNAKNQKHLHDYHPQCPICNFELSVFSDIKTFADQVKPEFNVTYCEPLIFACFSDHSKYSFLLRGPPLNIHNHYCRVTFKLIGRYAVA